MHHEWKVGDTAYVTDGWGGVRTHKVTKVGKVGKGRFTLDDGYSYMIRTGVRYGESEFRSRVTALPDTPENREWVRDQAARTNLTRMLNDFRRPGAQSLADLIALRDKLSAAIAEHIEKYGSE